MDGLGIPAKLAIGVVVQIFEWKCNFMNYSFYMLRFFKHGMNVGILLNRGLFKRLTVDTMHIAFMLDRG